VAGAVVVVVGAGAGAGVEAEAGVGVAAVEGHAVEEGEAEATEVISVVA
jgi:hypothetical protein